MNVRNTFIDFAPEPKQASSFARQSTEPALASGWRGPETPKSAAKASPATFVAMPLPDPQREAVAECSEDDGLELEAWAFVPQVTEYEYGQRPQDTLTQSLAGILSSMQGGSMPVMPSGGVPTNTQAAPPQLIASPRTGAGVPPPEWAGKSSVMFRNLPCDCTQQTLLAELNQNGFVETFDFFYLPIDKGTGGNRGYAFINFLDASIAWSFKLAYDGRMMSGFNSDKLVSVTPAALQGFEANYAHYATSRVKRGDPNSRPLFFRAPSAEGDASRLGVPASFIAQSAGIRKKGRGRLEQLVETQRREELIQQAVQQFTTTLLQQRQPPAAAAAAAPRKHFCFSCGHKINSDYQFCPNCGTSLR